MAGHRLDLIVAPTTGIAWRIDMANGSRCPGSFSSMPAVAGYPHLTVPMGKVKGLPLGISFIAWLEGQEKAFEPAALSLVFPDCRSMRQNASMSKASVENEERPTQASVSVIVPSYNGGRFIAEALDSILAQTLQTEQIIIVDDGSTDATGQIVSRYADPRIQYIRQEHAGLAAARNTGLNAARCEYVAFLNADDRWLPTFVETTHGFLAEDAAIVCVFANFVRVDPTTGKVLSHQFQQYPELRRPMLLRDEPNAHGRIPREKAFGALLACSEIPAHLQVMMFRRGLIKTTRFDPALATGNDIHFALKTFMLGGVVFTDQVLAEVRQPEGAVASDPGEIAIRKLDGLKAFAPFITRDVDVAAYRDRLIRAHIEAAVDQTKLGRVRAGLRTLRGSFGVPGSPLRKLKGSARVAMTLASGLMK